MCRGRFVNRKQILTAKETHNTNIISLSVIHDLDVQKDWYLLWTIHHFAINLNTWLVSILPNSSPRLSSPLPIARLQFSQRKKNRITKAQNRIAGSAESNGSERDFSLQSAEILQGKKSDQNSKWRLRKHTKKHGQKNTCSYQITGNQMDARSSLFGHCRKASNVELVH
jgi:CRISPR/Cas system-associated protein endoribonuclease Cas2